MRSGHSNVIRNEPTYSYCSGSHFFSTSPVSMCTVAVIHPQRMSTSVIVRSIIGILSDQKMTSRSLSLSADLFPRILAVEIFVMFSTGEREFVPNELYFISMDFFLRLSHWRIQSNFDNDKVVIRISVLSNGLLHTDVHSTHVSYNKWSAFCWFQNIARFNVVVKMRALDYQINAWCFFHMAICVQFQRIETHTRSLVVSRNPFFTCMWFEDWWHRCANPKRQLIFQFSWTNFHQKTSHFN